MITTQPPATPLILVVNDQDDLREVLAETLTVAGYRAITAASGPEAFVVAGVCLPQLAVIEVHMAGVSGTEVMRGFREDSALRHMPIIALTASGREERDSLLRAGFDEVITKPFPDELTNTVTRILGAPGTLGAAP